MQKLEREEQNGLAKKVIHGRRGFFSIDKLDKDWKQIWNKNDLLIFL